MLSKSEYWPIFLLRFNFGAQSGRPIPVKEQTVARSRTLSGGRCDAVFMWWDVFMDPDKKVRLSCAPKWAHPTPENLVKKQFLVSLFKACLVS